MGCFSGRLMSSASDQKLFCKLSSPFCCSFNEFVEEKVISPSYSSAILTPPGCYFLYWAIWAVCIVLEINPFLVTSFANIFFHPVDCLFILFIISFAVKKLLSRSHFLIFVFFPMTLGEESKKTVAAFMSKRILLVFSSRNFTVFSLPFRSLIHFEFIFYMVLENVLISFFYM